MLVSGRDFNLKNSSRFTIRRELGRGGMGAVYEAEDHVRGMTVALKTLLHLNAEALYHFKNEFRALADVHHPNLVSLYDLLEDQGQWFFTMEYLDGGELIPHLESGATIAAGTGTMQMTPVPAKGTAKGTPAPRGLRTAMGMMNTQAAGAGAGADDSSESALTRAASAAAIENFDEVRVRDCMAQLAEGLLALHDAGKVHRDIKPSNIWVTPEGRVVLLDFGLAADDSLLDEVQETGQLAGTPFYMAPEQGQPGAKIGRSADWYAFGVILYELLTGTLPHKGNNLQSLIAAKHTRPPTAPHELFSNRPKDLSTLALELLDPDPAKRPKGSQVLVRISHGVQDLGKTLRINTEAKRQASLFVGRRSELAVLESSLADSRKESVVCFVEGASGLGKTALISHFLEGPRGKQATVLKGRCYAAESLPYKAFDSIIDALSRHLLTHKGIDVPSLLAAGAAELAHLFPVLLRVPEIRRRHSDAPPSGSPQEMRKQAFEALTFMLRGLSVDAPVVLFIDDLQWADADSLLMLREMVRHPEKMPVLILASIRTSREDLEAGSSPQATLKTQSPMLVELAAFEARRIRLQPLSEADSMELVARLIPKGKGAAEDRLNITKEGRGHPLFLAELANFRARSGKAVRLDDALHARIRELDAKLSRVLDMVAIAGAPTANRSISRAVELKAVEVSRLANQLSSEHLLKITKSIEGDDLLEPYHDRVRETVLTNMEDGHFCESSGKLAAALQAAGVDKDHPEQLVRHLLAARRWPEARDMALRAARRAHEVLAFDQAADFARQALDTQPKDPDVRRELHICLAEALAAGGRGKEAAQAFLDAGADLDDSLQIDFRQRAAEQLLASGHVADGLEELKTVLHDLGEDIPETPSRALRSLGFHRAELADQGIRMLPRDDSEPPPARALRKLAVYQATSIGLILVDNVRGADFQARATLMAQRVASPVVLAKTWVFEAIYRAQEGSEGRASAEQYLEGAREIAAQTPDPYPRAYVVLGEAFMAYYYGQFKKAVEAFKKAEEVFRNLSGVAWEQNTIRLHRLRATDYQGAWGELRALYDEYLEDARRRNDRYVEASITRWFNVLWLANDQPELAGADLDKSVWRAPQPNQYHLQHFLELRARVELAFYRGDGARQSQWALPGLDAAEDSMLLRIQIAQAIADWLRGRLATCDGDAAEVDRQASKLEAQDINYAHIWGGLLRGAHLALIGDSNGAVRALENTALYADDNDFPLCAAIARLRSAQLQGEAGAAQREASLQWMQAQEIHNPERMAELFAPGFPS